MEGFLLLGIAIFLIWLFIKEGDLPIEQTAHAKREMEKNMICPYCQTKGTVTTQNVKRKAGISGGKATAAILTCGISMLGTGLSRKQSMTEARCSHCGAVWSY